MLIKIQLLGVVSAVLVGAVAPACAANSPTLNQGIQDYNSHAYAAAIAKLARADQHDSLVHYYMAMSYQGLGNYATAEREYTWVYKNSKDAKLRMQAWQGLKGLASLSAYRASSGPRVAATASGAATAETKKPVYQAVDVKYVDAHGRQTGSNPADWTQTTFTPGCPRHRM